MGTAVARTAWTWREITRRLPFGARLARIGEYRLLLAGLALLVASVWVFGLLVEGVVTSDPIVRTDRRVANWLHEHATGGLTDVFRVVTRAGNGLVLAGVCLVASVFLLHRRRLGDAASSGSRSPAHRR